MARESSLYRVHYPFARVRRLMGEYLGLATLLAASAVINFYGSYVTAWPLAAYHKEASSRSNELFGVSLPPDEQARPPKNVGAGHQADAVRPGAADRRVAALDRYRRVFHSRPAVAGCPHGRNTGRSTVFPAFPSRQHPGSDEHPVPAAARPGPGGASVG